MTKIVFLNNEIRDILNILRKYIPSFLRENFFLKRVFIYFFSHFFLIKKLKKQLVNHNISSENSPSKVKKRVLITTLETSHNGYYRLLILGKALELRGSEVRVLICNKLLEACEIKSIKNKNDPNPCWDCKFNIDKILPIYNLKTINMQSLIPIKKEEIWRKFLQKKGLNYKNIKKFLPFAIEENIFNKIINDSIVRYFYGNISSNSKILRKVKFGNIVDLLRSSYCAKKIDELWNPDVVLSINYVYSSWAPFYEYYKKYGNRYSNLATSQFNKKTVHLNTFDLYPAKERFISFVNTLKNKKLNKKQNLELDKFLKIRFSGNNQVALDNSYFQELDLTSIKEKLSFDPNKRNIFLFSNVFWDVGIANMDFLFKDVISWVRRTIEFVSHDKSINLYIKTHPAEKYDSSKSLIGVADIMRKEFDFNLPNNIFFIEPEMKIKPYDLIPMIDLAIVFSGTLGLEISLNEKPVVSTGITPQHNLGLTNEPKSEREYEMYLKGEKKVKCPSIQEIRKFAYFYFIKSCIPWDLQENVYDDYFSGFKFNSLKDIEEGKNEYLDHICECLLNKENKVIENW